MQVPGKIVYGEILSKPPKVQQKYELLMILKYPPLSPISTLIIQSYNKYENSTQQGNILHTQHSKLYKEHDQNPAIINNIISRQLCRNMT